MFDNLLLAREGQTALVTINRPQVLNALNAQTLSELRRVFDELRDDAGVRVVIVTGSGDKAFVAGADIGELAALSPAKAQAHALIGQRVFDKSSTSGSP